MNLKYVIFDELYAVVFSGALTHSRVRYIPSISDEVCGIRGLPTSAGFVSIFTSSRAGGITVNCYGRSESLGIDSKPNDCLLVKCALGL